VGDPFVGRRGPGRGGDRRGHRGRGADREDQRRPGRAGRRRRTRCAGGDGAADVRAAVRRRRPADDHDAVGHPHDDDPGDDDPGDDDPDHPGAAVDDRAGAARRRRRRPGDQRPVGRPGLPRLRGRDELAGPAGLPGPRRRRRAGRV
ncbi:MAG: hypothetical protein AVDCRST_MAG54-2014, partial [uncultured Actinomycetospora sp.]